MAGVFISYRREDSAGHAGRICEHLSFAFGADHVFMDIQDIAPGDDFTKAIDSKVSQCNVLVAVIGRQWVSTLEARRQQQDFVRYEVMAALNRGITVIPVLVGGAKMPDLQAMPANLAPFAKRQAVEIRDDRFDDDIKILVAALRRLTRPPEAIRRRRLVGALTILLAPAAITFVAIRMKRRASFDISGVWIAEMQKAGRQAYRVRFELVESAGRIIGSVSYPTGDGAIQDGTLQGSHIAFSTRHLPQFASEPATIRYTGNIVGSELSLVSVDDSGVAKGIARKITPVRP